MALNAEQSADATNFLLAVPRVQVFSKKLKRIPNVFESCRNYHFEKCPSKAMKNEIRYFCFFLSFQLSNVSFFSIHPLAQSKLASGNFEMSVCARIAVHCVRAASPSPP